MAKKREMKESEARILVYLSQVPNTQKSLEDISAKLNIDYVYCIRILKEMVSKNWVYKHKLGRKMYYDLEINSPVDRARQELANRDPK